VKRLTVLATTIAVMFVVAAPAQAWPGPYLGPGEAARLTGKALNTEYNNVAQGSLDAYCPKVPGRRDFRRCYYTYYDDGGGCWSGATAIRNVSYTRFRYRILWDDRCY
jgi:hypothetical protein